MGDRRIPSTARPPHRRRRGVPGAIAAAIAAGLASPAGAGTAAAAAPSIVGDFDPARFGALPAPAAAGVIAAVGLLFWWSGGRTIRPAVVAAGISLGALLGWRFGHGDGPVAALAATTAMPPIAVAGMGGLAGAMIATVLHRITIALGLGVVLAAAAGGLTLVLHAPDAAERAPTERVAAAGSAATTPDAPDLRTIAQVLGLDDAAAAPLAAAAGPTLDAATAAAASVAGDARTRLDRVAADLDPAASAAGRRLALLAATTGLLAGTLLGLFAPGPAAKLVTATAGAGLLVVAGRLALPGYVPAPGEPGGLVVLAGWAGLALIGAARQAREARRAPAIEPALVAA